MGIAGSPGFAVRVDAAAVAAELLLRGVARCGPRVPAFLCGAGADCCVEATSREEACGDLELDCFIAIPVDWETAMGVDKFRDQNTVL